MWIVQCKPDKHSQSLSTVGSYDNKRGAIIHASRLLGECFMVIVSDQDDDVIWSNGMLVIDPKATVNNSQY